MTLRLRERKRRDEIEKWERRERRERERRDLFTIDLWELIPQFVPELRPRT